MQVETRLNSISNLNQTEREIFSMKALTNEHSRMSSIDFTYLNLIKAKALILKGEDAIRQVADNKREIDNKSNCYAVFGGFHLSDVFSVVQEMQVNKNADQICRDFLDCLNRKKTVIETYKNQFESAIQYQLLFQQQAINPLDLDKKIITILFM